MREDMNQFTDEELFAPISHSDAESEKIAALHGRDVSNATEELWWTMAYSQFHDILTGSHPTNV